MQHKRILVVEDDILTQFVMGEMLEDLGYPYDIAEDGSACMEIMKDSPGAYFLILMDINMPRMSGIEVTSKIRSTDQDPPMGIPIVAVTADVHWQEKTRCERNGFTDVLAKPVRMDSLEAHVRQYDAV